MGTVERTAPRLRVSRRTALLGFVGALAVAAVGLGISAQPHRRGAVSLPATVTPTVVVSDGGEPALARGVARGLTVPRSEAPEQPMRFAPTLFDPPPADAPEDMRRFLTEVISIRTRFEAAYGYYAVLRHQVSENRIARARYWSALIALGDVYTELANEARMLDSPASAEDLPDALAEVFDRFAAAADRIVRGESPRKSLWADELNALPGTHPYFARAFNEYAHVVRSLEDLARPYAGG